jgi:hypothetical protein|tara:strand:+ start:526 stop:696 length:171 start_codon:yes stop_codon:yes gene_type:complete
MKSIDISEATPIALRTWAESDFNLEGNFDPLTLFVTLPALIQFAVFSAMAYVVGAL